jgi:hypothetical protein
VASFAFFRYPRSLPWPPPVLSDAGFGAKALGVSRNLRVSPPQERVTSNYFGLGQARPPNPFGVLLGAEPLRLAVIFYSWWCLSVNFFKFQPCDRTPPGAQALKISRKVLSGSKINTAQSLVGKVYG